MKKHKLEQTIIQTENLMTKIHNNNKIQQTNERKLLKSLLIIFTVIITIIYGLAVKVSLQYKGEAINQLEYIQLKNILKTKYYCNQVYFVNNTKLSQTHNQILLQDLRGCISYEHYYEENINEFSNAIHKCAIIRSQDMIDEFIRYQKIQFLAFQASNDTLIISQIRQKIAKYQLQNLRSLFWENADGKIYTIIQYKKPFQVNDRGYYIGNEDKKIQKQFNYSQIFNNQLIKFYQKEQARNILDLGCGLCNYIINIKNAGFQAEGYDGNPYTPQLTSGFGKVLDLTKKNDLQKKFDWVQSFQVGQHIPPSKTYIYVQNMVRHARKGIIISWGILGQKGLFYVNTKKNENVIKIFQSYNFTFDQQSTTQFRQKNNDTWVKNNLLIFRKK